MAPKKLKSRKRSAKAVAFERKLRDYKRFLKGDEDYDGHYILRMLCFKLERTRDHIVGHGIIEGAPQVGREIQEVVNLLKRIEADRYFEELHKPFWKKYGKPKMKSGKPDARGFSLVTIAYPRPSLSSPKVSNGR